MKPKNLKELRTVTTKNGILYRADLKMQDGDYNVPLVKLKDVETLIKNRITEIEKIKKSLSHKEHREYCNAMIDALQQILGDDK